MYSQENPQLKALCTEQNPEGRLPDSRGRKWPPFAPGGRRGDGTSSSRAGSSFRGSEGPRSIGPGSPAHSLAPFSQEGKQPPPAMSAEGSESILHIQQAGRGSPPPPPPAVSLPRKV